MPEQNVEILDRAQLPAAKNEPRAAADLARNHLLDDLADHSSVLKTGVVAATGATVFLKPLVFDAYNYTPMAAGLEANVRTQASRLQPLWQAELRQAEANMQSLAASNARFPAAPGNWRMAENYAAPRYVEGVPPITSWANPQEVGKFRAWRELSGELPGAFGPRNSGYIESALRTEGVGMQRLSSLNFQNKAFLSTEFKAAVTEYNTAIGAHNAELALIRQAQNPQRALSAGNNLAAFVSSQVANYALDKTVFAGVPVSNRTSFIDIGSTALMFAPGNVWLRATGMVAAHTGARLWDVHDTKK